MRSREARSIPAPIATLLLVASLAGCLGAGQTPEASQLPAEPSVRFGSFEEALAADGTAYQPVGVGGAESGSAGGCGHGVDGLDYETNHTFSVGSEHADQVAVRVSVNPVTPAHRYEFTLRDPAGQVVDTATLNVLNPESWLSTSNDDVPAGEWTVEVDGHGVDVIYDVEWTVYYSVGPPLTLKLLEPLDPIEPGPAPFVFLLYEEDAKEPVEDADVGIRSRMSGSENTSDEEEADPVHDDHGVYVGQIQPDRPGDWIVEVDLPFDGAEIPFEPHVTVEDPDGDDRSGRDARTRAVSPAAPLACFGST